LRGVCTQVFLAEAFLLQTISVAIRNEMNNCRANLKFIGLSIILAGIAAGIVSTLIQMLLWLIFTDGLPAILYRDARLTAAVVLGISVLPPPATFDAMVMLVATFIHFSLSVIYAALLASIAAFLKSVPAFLLGIGFGGMLYLVNLYGFTMIFPWFDQTRGWITLIAHGVFGLTAILVYQGLNARVSVKNAQC
jgi:hypothetical protein